MPNKKSKRIAIALIVNDQDNILMGKRNDTDKWTVPAGKIEKGECPFVGMARELKEETGLDAKNIQMLKCEFKKDMLFYLFKVEVNEDQEVDCSKDPDKECDNFTYEDPFDHLDELHVPAEINIAIKYWACS
jgi:mutator protein MutT